MLISKKFIIWLVILSALWLGSAKADVVKPALIEIIANTNGTLIIEIRTSIEALLTGINNQYKNTKDAPNSDKYDVLRNLNPDILLQKFEDFEADFLNNIKIIIDKIPVELVVLNTKIPEVGYSKVPRISLIVLNAVIPKNSKTLQWFYPLKFGDNAVRVKQVNPQKQQYHWSDWQWLRNNLSSKQFSLQALFKPISIWHRIKIYAELGIVHIIPRGMDHILFILGIFLFSLKLRPMLTQITMFTVAHTITLGLAINGFISLPVSVVEPMIALSIAYIGVENMIATKMSNHRLALVFAFGLLHGLGFANILGDFGMPDEAFVIALLSFNIGVEIAQISIILVAFALVFFWRHSVLWQKTRIVASLIIASIGSYLFLERLL